MRLTNMPGHVFFVQSISDKELNDELVMRPIRLICANVTPGGLTGAPKRLLMLSQVLRDCGLEPIIVTDPDSQLMEKARKIGISAIDCPIPDELYVKNNELMNSSIFVIIRLLFLLARQNLKFFVIIRSSKADAVWIRSTRGMAFYGFGAFLSGKPIIWDIALEPKSKGFFGYVHKFGLRASNAMVLQYDKLAFYIENEYGCKKYKRKSVSLIPGIELKGLLPYNRMRRKFQSYRRSSSFIMLQVGTICARKNQSFLIDVMVQAEADGVGDGWELWLVGDMRSDTEIKNKIDKYSLHEKVLMFGWSDDIHGIMCKADLLLMPSKDEGVPNAVQEAMFMGLPVIASDAGGIPEIIQNDVTGWVLPCDIPERWAEKMIWCKENPAQCIRVGNNASRYASDHFNPVHWGGKYAAIIRSVIKKEQLDGKSVSS